MTPWSKNECEKRYIEGPSITLKSLAELSGVSFNTLRKWSKLGQWSQKQSEFRAKVVDQTREKTIQKTSDLLSDLTLEHLKVYKIYREIASIRGQFVLENLKKAFPDQLQENDDSLEDSLVLDLRKELQSRESTKLDVMALSLLSQMADRCIRGERMAAGLDYEDINKAIAAVERAGFKVAADGATLAQFVTGKVCEEHSTDQPDLSSASF